MKIKVRLTGWFLASLAAGVTHAFAVNYSVVHSFGILTNVSGFQPQSALVQDASGTLYGVTSVNDGNVQGSVFKIKPDGTGFQVLKGFSPTVNFTNSDGANPVGSLALSGATLYGTTSAGGTGGSGNIFSINTDGTGFAVLTNLPSAQPALTNTLGAYPYGGLILSGSTLYGTTHGGGAGGSGTIFSISTSGGGFTVLKAFSAVGGLGQNGDGADPDGSLVMAGGILYGTAVNGGSNAYGSIYALNPATMAYSVIYTFLGGSDGGNPHSGLCYSNGWLYGTAAGGGSAFSGTVYMLNLSGSIFHTIYTFSGGNDGSTPYGGVILAGATLYGTTYGGGPDRAGNTLGFGTVFAVNTNGSGFTNLFQFDGGASGANPQATLIFSGNALYGSTGGVYGEQDTAGGNGTLFAVNTNGGFTNIYTFKYTDAAQPWSGLVVSNHTLFGTTYGGGASGQGAIYKVNTDGTGYAIIKSFSAFGYDAAAPDFTASTNFDGANPGGDIAVSGNTLYGAAFYGGNYGYGTLYSVNMDGTGFTNLHNFTGGSDGAYPKGGLVLANGMLYGTASGGGSNEGVVFAISPNGAGFTVLKTFSATVNYTNADGAAPYAGLAASGNTLFGATYYGGGHGYGSVFALNASTKAFVNLHSFTGGSDGAYPYAGLLLSGNWLYGVAVGGGTNNTGSVFMVTTNASSFIAVKNFSADPSRTNADGANPYAGLALYGNSIYGTTGNGGANGAGTLFSVNTNGSGATFAALVNFAATNGANPYGRMVFSGNALYGTTLAGGNVGDGTVFSLTLFPLIPLTITQAGPNVILTWSDPNYSLISSPTLDGIYTNVPNATSPYTNAITGTQQFFELEAP
jgi:uncharacterized repeat protein (TIGR03803 family)